MTRFRPLLLLAVLCAPCIVPPSYASVRQLNVKRNPVYIRAQHLPISTLMDPESIAQRDVVRAFLQTHPNYEIDPFTMPELGIAAAMDSGPLMAIAAGVPPHCIYVNFRQSSTYINQGFLEPLEVLVARLNSANERVRQVDSNDRWISDPTHAEIEEALRLIRQRVPDPVWPVVYRKADSLDSDDKKHVWSLPLSNLVMALIYRKDLFHAAGLDPDRPPETWDELITYARKLRVPEKGQYGMVAYGGSVDISWGVYGFLVSTGARAVVRNDQGDWQSAFGNRQCAKAIHFIWRMVHEPWIRESDGKTIAGAMKLATSEDHDQLFARGLVGMRMDYLGEEVIGDLNPQLIGIAPVPRSHSGARGSEVNCKMLGVFADSSKLQQLAVMELIWFFTSEQAQRIRVRNYVEHGLGKFVSPILLKQFGYDRLLRRVPKGWQKVFATAMAHGVPEPYGKNTQNIYRYMSQPINEGLELLTRHPDWTEEKTLSELEQLCVHAAARVDVELLGALPDSEMRTRRIIAAISLSFLAAAFVWMVISTWRYFTAMATPMIASRCWRRFLWGYILITPGLLLVLWWQYLPLGAGLAIAFTDFHLVRNSLFVGLDNFAMVMFDDRFWMSMLRTLYFVALMIGLAFWPPILLAILLQEVPTTTLKYFFRTIFYLPQVLAGVVVYFLWFQLFDATESGVLNKLLLGLNTLPTIPACLVKCVLAAMWVSFIYMLFVAPIKVYEMSRTLKVALWLIAIALTGITVTVLLRSYIGSSDTALQITADLLGRFNIVPFRWIKSPQAAMLCLIIPTVWATAGPGCIIYLAALKTVPNELYEAADIDGASHWHKVFYIVLPRLKYLIMIQFIAAVIAAFKGGTEYVLIMTGGGPKDATNLLSLEIFRVTFMDLKYGIGTAMAWLLGGLLIGFTAYQLRLLSRAEFRTAEIN